VHKVGGAELRRSTGRRHLLRQPDQFERFSSCNNHHQSS